MSSHSPLRLGGQALIEGVMIRAPESISIAVRKPDGEIVTQKKSFRSLTQRHKIFGLPLVRGFVQICEMMVLGMKALNFSASIALDEVPSEDKPQTRWQILKNTLTFALSLFISIGLAIALFKALPLFAAKLLQKNFPLFNNTLAFNIADGLIRIAVFFLYIGALALLPSFKRIFAYHGAEHMAVAAYEKGRPLTLQEVARESPRHPRCGTSFLLLALIVSIAILSLVPKHPSFFIFLFRRVLVLPLVLGAGYEVLKFTGRYEKGRLAKILAAPGLATQYLTTKYPDEKQMEVAIAAVEKAVEKT